MVIGNKEEILRRIGQDIREHRLRKNLSQLLLAQRSGVSLTVVKRLESGYGATLGSFALICRTLGQDGWIEALHPQDVLSPIAYADALRKAEAKKRRRAHV